MIVCCLLKILDIGANGTDGLSEQRSEIGRNDFWSRNWMVDLTNYRIIGVIDLTSSGTVVNF